MQYRECGAKSYDAKSAGATPGCTCTLCVSASTPPGDIIAPAVEVPLEHVLRHRSPPPLIIAVIGAGEPSNEVADLAEKVGRELGERGLTLVCGGLGGVMEAACRGVKSAGGTTIGVLPGSDPNVKNRWLDYPIGTGLSYARNIIIVKTGRAVIAVGGAYGTLSEIGTRCRAVFPSSGSVPWV
jgi:uncharacterized protein (TIGR00725 family)